MVVSKYTEDFVGLCIETFFMTEKYKDFFSKNLNIKTINSNFPHLTGEDGVKLDEIKREANHARIKILFRIEHCEDYHMPAAQVITEIIDKTIGSNYMKRRPSDEQLRDIIQNHNS